MKRFADCLRRISSEVSSCKVWRAISSKITCSRLCSLCCGSSVTSNTSYSSRFLTRWIATRTKSSNARKKSVQFILIRRSNVCCNFTFFPEKEKPDPKQRIREIDEMSASEYDQLSNEDKKMYIDTILPRKKEEAARRRTRFMERMIERTKRKVLNFVHPSKERKRKRIDSKSITLWMTG